MTHRLLSAIAAILLLAARGLCAAPVPEVDIHDPAMAKEAGTYSLFSTGPGIPFYSSKDRVHWVEGGRVFASEPVWARSITQRFNGHLWAPDVSRHDGKYYLYYSVSGFGRNDSAIGVTTNKALDPTSPDYRWEDHGIVLRSVAGRDLWNAIDPNVVVDGNGTPWMTFGSFWSGIKLVKLSADWTKLATPEEWHSIAARPRAAIDDRAPGSGEIEGPFLFRKGDYYYLFVSTGLCCRGKNSTYRVTVGRSKEITGPYLDRDGKDMVQGGGTPLIAENRAWAGWGGQGVYTFDGKDYVVIHAYEAADNSFHRLKIAEIKWDTAGWPTVDTATLDRFHAYLKK
jgi:arabinan endo-1,5-alpha-L-arabinosidase